jgi:putative oxidoreductase
MPASSNPPSRNATIALWALRVVMAVLFVLSGIMKLTGNQTTVQEFDTVGLGQWLRYLTGLLEVVGGLAVLAPSVSAFGAIILLIVDVGAFFAQIGALHIDWIHPIVIGALLAALIYWQREQIQSRLGM